MAAASGLSDLTLCVEQPGQAGQEVYVQHGLTLGRDSANTVQIDHPDVERIHVRILREASGEYAMECLGNAMLRADDGQKIPRTVLEDGTSLSIGPARITCRRRRSQPTAVIGDDPWQVRCPRCHASLAGEPHDLQSCPACGDGVFFCHTEEEQGAGKNGFEGWLPREVGPYLVERLAGVGGMGIVLRGMNRETGVPAAIKLLRNDPRGDPSWRVRFLREAEVLKKVKHRNVVRLQDCGEDEHLVWLAMDWVDGEPLSKVLSRTRLAGQQTPTPQIKDWMEQTIEGLSHLHALGIVHRDLKPENILVADDGLVKIADVGLAKTCQGVTQATQVTQTGMVAGTPGYMSPEQAQGRDLTAASDVYSLGVIWLEMMTGHTPLSLPHGVLIPDGGAYPEEWTECARRCLLPDSSQRPALQGVRSSVLQRGVLPLDRSPRLDAICVLVAIAVCFEWAAVWGCWWVGPLLGGMVFLLVPHLLRKLSGRFVLRKARLCEARGDSVGAASWLSTAEAVEGVFRGASKEAIEANERLSKVYGLPQEGTPLRRCLIAVSLGVVWWVVLILLITGYFTGYAPFVAGQNRLLAFCGASGAAVDLGLCYERGFGVEKDEAAAAKWYAKAALKGNARGYVLFGLMVRDGRWGKKKDETFAARLFRATADAGYTPGMVELGVAYQNGGGVPKNDEEAYKWFKRAADAGNIDGMRDLAWMLTNGFGVAKNDPGAVQWYRRAAQAGDSQGMLYLGEMYENGNGVPKDLSEAAKWYRQAAKAGHPDAEKLLRRVGAVDK